MSVWDEVGAFVDEKFGELLERAVSAESQLEAAKDELAAALVDVTGASKRIDELEAEVAKITADLMVARARIAELETHADPAGWVTLYDSTFEKNDGWKLNQETQSNDNSYNTPKNVTFGQGMTIIGKRETLGGKPYTSGDVLGQHIRVPNYFRAEVVATTPVDFGMWPCALWFRPLNSIEGEIDVMETWPFDWTAAKPARLVSTLHSEYGTTHQQANASLAYSKLPNPDPTAPHTYTVEKVKGCITFWCDGVLVYSWLKGKLNAKVDAWFDRIFEVPERLWYPRITLQIGGPNAKEPKPEWRESRMVIHRLRIYKEA